MAKRNLTIQLDESVIRQAKIIAAKRGTSVSGLVARELEDLASHDARYEQSWRRAEEVMKQAAARGGRKWDRGELHER
jgi:hypothetical protein